MRTIFSGLRRSSSRYKAFARMPYAFSDLASRNAPEFTLRDSPLFVRSSRAQYEPLTSRLVGTNLTPALRRDADNPLMWIAGPCGVSRSSSGPDLPEQDFWTAPKASMRVHRCSGCAGQRKQKAIPTAYQTASIMAPCQLKMALQSIGQQCLSPSTLVSVTRYRGPFQTWRGRNGRGGLSSARH